MSAAGTCTGIFKGHQLLHHFTCTSCTLSFYWGLVEFCFLTNYAFIQKKLGGIKKLITSFRWPKKLSIFGEIQLFWFNVHWHLPSKSQQHVRHHYGDLNAQLIFNWLTPTKIPLLQSSINASNLYVGFCKIIWQQRIFYNLSARGHIK